MQKIGKDRLPRRVRYGTVIIVVLVLVCLPGRSWLAERRFLAEVKGKPAPDFVLTALNGDDVRLSELRGRPLVLGFWAVG
jgi:hypothetical protein